MNAKKISFCAIMSALGCAILYLGSLIEVMDMSMAAIASFLVVICGVGIDIIVLLYKFFVVFLIVCVFLCLTGVGVLSLTGGWKMSIGDILTVLSGFWSVYMGVKFITAKNKNEKVFYIVIITI